MFKLLLETVDDSPSILDGSHMFSRETALFVFDSVRQSERVRRGMNTALYSNITLASDDVAEAPNGWVSGDEECRWIVDGESFTVPDGYHVELYCIVPDRTGERV